MRCFFSYPKFTALTYWIVLANFKRPELRSQHLLAAVAVMIATSSRETRATGSNTSYHGCRIQQTPQSNLTGTCQEEEKGAATETLKQKDKYLKTVYAWICQNQKGQDRKEKRIHKINSFFFMNPWSAQKQHL